MIYNGRECEIRVVPVGLLNGSYAFTVEIVEGDAVIDRHAESIPLEALRARADAHATSVAVERDNAVTEAVGRANERFRDIVDIEA